MASLKPVVSACAVALLFTTLTAVVAGEPLATAAVPHVLDRAAASAQAVATGQAVVVDTLVTANQLVTANPDGSFTARLDDGPVRFWSADGSWHDIDNTLVRQENGTVTPAASPAQIVLSGGAGAGDNVVASMGSGTGQVALGWRGALPVPVLDGSTATYPQVRPGVDLVVAMTRVGFEQNLVVHDAAALGALATIDLPWHTGTGGRFTIPPAKMWDAGIDPRSGNHTRTAPVGIAVGPALAGSTGWGASLRMTPAMTVASAAAAGWQYPITIDPGVLSTAYATWDSYIQKNSGDNEDNSGESELRIGTETSDAAPGEVIARTFIHWNTSVFAGSTVSLATLHLYNFHSWTCNPTTTWDVYRTSTTSSSTRWGSSVSWYTTPPVVTSSSSKGYSGCSAGFVTSTVTEHMKYAAQNNLTQYNMGIRSHSESNVTGWKKFYSSNNSDPDRDPYVSVTYNYSPTIAAGTAKSNGAACASGTSRPYVTTTTPKLSASVADRNGSAQTLTPKFEWRLINTDGTYPASGVTQNAAAVTPTSGTASMATSITVSSALINGRSYAWRVMVTDSAGAASAWTPAATPWCEFTVDTSKPPTPDIQPAAGSPYTEDSVAHGDVGLPVQFTIAYNATDVASYTYTVVAQNVNYTKSVLVPIGTTGATLSVEPQGAGLMTVSVTTTDVAGNPAAGPASSTVNVAASPSTGAWITAGQGTSIDDASTTTTPHPLALGGGAGWTSPADGHLVGGVDPGLALPSGAYAATSAAVLNTSASYSVSAWVRLDAAGPGAATAASQDGANTAGFQLQAQGSTWCFTARTADTPIGGFSTSACAGGVVYGRWAHLIGVYDAYTHLLSISVNGQAGTPVAFTATWNAGGPLQLGRARMGATYADDWIGAVQDVRVWQRPMFADEIAAIANGYGDSGVPTLVGEWDFDDVPGTATAADVSGYGRDLTLAGGPVFNAAPAVPPASGTGVLQIAGAGSVAAAGPVVRTSSSFTVTANVLLNSGAAAYATAVSQGGTTTAFQLGARNGTWCFTTHDADTAADAATYTCSTAAAFHYGQWTSLVAVYDAGAKNIRLYVDGVLAAGPLAVNAGVWANGIWESTGPLQVGRHVQGTSYVDPWSGQIDDVRIYSGALDPIRFPIILG